TFALVRHHFQDLFTTMFGGGKADIVLEDGDSLESGVEIYASPPFKRLKAMSLLSEGEKTLCALSFIFALIRVRPAPFCVLDEVDASLDDANVIRFNRLIRSFSEESQFLVVTHNRYTMEMADILYGVTFDVPGISKVVSMALKNSEG
ncbi:MAG: AAA family ATPase, partial [Desulfomonilia bacterium]|nr:AAA family ATPase [Desulfomonilia bacterium]